MELTGGGGSPLLRVTGLRKRYPSFELRDVSLEVPAGRIVGFVGRNGAGKTTTLRCVTGAARADGGSVEAFGRDAAEDWAAMRRLTGIVLGGALYYETKTLAAIAGVTSRIFDTYRLVKTPRQISPGAPALTRAQIALCGLLDEVDAKGVQELAAALGKTPRTVQRTLQGLLDNGLVVATAPRTSRDRKYLLSHALTSGRKA